MSLRQANVKMVGKLAIVAAVQWAAQRLLLRVLATRQSRDAAMAEAITPDTGVPTAPITASVRIPFISPLRKRKLMS